MRQIPYYITRNGHPCSLNNPPAATLFANHESPTKTLPEYHDRSHCIGDVENPTYFSPKGDAPYLCSVEDFAEAESWFTIGFCDCSDLWEDVSAVAKDTKKVQQLACIRFAVRGQFFMDDFLRGFLRGNDIILEY